MPDLGNRANVMGPQPIGQPKPLPPAMLEAAERVMGLIAGGKFDEIAAMAAPDAVGIDELRENIRPGKYDKRGIVGCARVNEHYFVKAQLTGPGVEPYTFQIRLGEHQGRWKIWEAMNLSGRRSAWTR
jgi:hypothetical protein